MKKKVSEIPGEEYYKEGGFIYCTYEIPEKKYSYANQYLNLDGKKWSFNATQKKYVRMIADICAKKNIELVFVTAPIANVSMGFINNYSQIHNEIAEFANETGVPYIDYNIVNMEEYLLSNKNFRDDAHVNYSGSVIVGEHFARWLGENIRVYNGG